MLKDAYDLESLIFEGNNNPYNSNEISIQTKIGSDIIQIGSIFDKYIDFIKGVCIKVKLNEVERQKYKYNPKKLSYDLYKTEELWSLILKLNNLGSEIEFIPNSIYILNPNEKEMLNKILILSDDEIKNNHQTYM